MSPRRCQAFHEKRPFLHVAGPITLTIAQIKGDQRSFFGIFYNGEIENKTIFILISFKT